MAELELTCAGGQRAIKGVRSALDLDDGSDEDEPEGAPAAKQRRSSNYRPTIDYKAPEDFAKLAKGAAKAMNASFKRANTANQGSSKKPRSSKSSGARGKSADDGQSEAGDDNSDAVEVLPSKTRKRQDVKPPERLTMDRSAGDSLVRAVQQLIKVGRQGCTNPKGETCTFDVVYEVYSAIYAIDPAIFDAVFALRSSNRPEHHSFILNAFIGHLRARCTLVSTLSAKQQVTAINKLRDAARALTGIEDWTDPFVRWLCRGDADLTGVH